MLILLAGRLAELADFDIADCLVRHTNERKTI